MSALARFVSRMLCLLGCHDWREMDGYCRECGKLDRFQFEDRNDD